jgi:CheY-like chemotaxis protein
MGDEEGATHMAEPEHAPASRWDAGAAIDTASSERRADSIWKDLGAEAAEAGDAMDVEETPAPVSATTSATDAQENGPQCIAVVDPDPAWEKAGRYGDRIVVVSPKGDVGARVAESGAGRIVLNLAAPAALQTLRALRASGSTVPIWGCVATPANDRVLGLGTVELAEQPLDVDAVVKGLDPYLGRNSRIVVVGSDPRFASLRLALICKLMSVTIAWDAKQAVDLLKTSVPEVIVVDLAMPRPQGYEVVAHLSTLNPIPHAVLVAGGEETTGFGDLLKTHGSSGISRAALLTEMAKKPLPATAKKQLPAHLARVLGRLR